MPSALISCLQIQQHYWCPDLSLPAREVGRSEALIRNQAGRSFLLPQPARLTSSAELALVPTSLSSLPGLLDLGLTTSSRSPGFWPLLLVCTCFSLFLPAPHLTSSLQAQYPCRCPLFPLPVQLAVCPPAATPVNVSTAAPEETIRLCLNRDSPQ